MAVPTRRSALVACLLLIAIDGSVVPGSGASAAGQPAGPPSVVASATEGATASNNQVKIVRAPAGLVVAYLAPAAGTTQVFLAVSRDNGARWAPLAQASGGPVPSRLPTLAADGAGRIHVIWTRYDDGVGKIYYRVWAGRWMAAQARISPPSGYAGYPALALDRAGRPQVVWYGIRPGEVPAPTRHGSIYEIYYTGYTGRTWSPPLLISPGVPDSVNPAMAADGTGRLFAAWYQFDGHVYQIRYAESEGTWSRPEGVVRTRVDEFAPDVAVDPRAGVSLAWEHHDAQTSAIYYARRVQGRWDGPVALSRPDAAAHHPSVAVAPGGGVYVVWDQDDGQIYLRRFAGRWDPLVRLTTDGGNTFPSVSADGAGADVVWTHAGAPQPLVDFVRFSRP